MSLRRIVAVVCGVTSLLLVSMQALASEPPAGASELNLKAMESLRKGEWEIARRVAKDAAAASKPDSVDWAEAMLLLATAELRSGDRVAASATWKQLEPALAGVQADHWLHREARGLRTQILGDAPPAPPSPPGRSIPKEGEARTTTDLGVTLWSIRYANSQHDWKEAARLTAEALERNDLDDAASRCDVLLHRYAALRHLEDPGASAVSQQFDEKANDLPASSTLPLQMALLRESLGDKAGGPALPSAYVPPADDRWTVVKPESVGADPAKIREHVEYNRITGADAVLVLRRGKIVSEWYSPLYREPVLTMSSVKSINGLLAGLLVGEGRLRLDDPVSKYVPEWREGLAAHATVRHVLTMTAGLPKRRDMGVAASGESGMNAFVRQLRPEWEPGTRWAYSNEGAQLMSPILEAAAGEPLTRYAQRALFEPMGLRRTQLRTDGVGNAITYADAATTLREFAAFGQLVLDDGRVGDRRLLASEWMQAMTTPTSQRAGYGMMWWLYEKPRIVAMEGYLNTSCWVFPELEVVVVRVQSTPYLHARENFDARRMFEMMERAMRN